MIDITLKHILPPYSDDRQKKVNVSELYGIDKMFIPHEDQAKLFLQFFSKAVLDRNLQDVVSKSYTEDLQGIARIFEYGNMSGQMKVDDSNSAAYGLLAMVVGLSFFRVANITPLNNEDNRYICEDYVRRLVKG